MAAIGACLGGSLLTIEMLRLVQVATVSACGTGAVATISRRGAVLLVFPLCRVSCRRMLKWRRLLMTVRLRCWKCMLLRTSVRALMMTLVLFVMALNVSWCRPGARSLVSYVMCMFSGVS